MDLFIFNKEIVHEIFHFLCCDISKKHLVLITLSAMIKLKRLKILDYTSQSRLPFIHDMTGENRNEVHCEQTLK